MLVVVRWEVGWPQGRVSRVPESSPLVPLGLARTSKHFMFRVLSRTFDVWPVRLFVAAESTMRHTRASHKLQVARASVKVTVEGHNTYIVALTKKILDKKWCWGPGLKISIRIPSGSQVDFHLSRMQVSQCIGAINEKTRALLAGELTPPNTPVCVTVQGKLKDNPKNTLSTQTCVGAP